MKSKAIKEELDNQRKIYSKLSKVKRCTEYASVNYFLFYLNLVKKHSEFLQRKYS